MSFSFEESILVGCDDAPCGLVCRRFEGTSCSRIPRRVLVLI